MDGTDGRKTERTPLDPRLRKALIGTKPRHYDVSFMGSVLRSIFGMSEEERDILMRLGSISSSQATANSTRVARYKEATKLALEHGSPDYTNEYTRRYTKGQEIVCNLRGITSRFGVGKKELRVKRVRNQRKWVLGRRKKDAIHYP